MKKQYVDCLNEFSYESDYHILVSGEEPPLDFLRSNFGTLSLEIIQPNLNGEQAKTYAGDFIYEVNVTSFDTQLSSLTDKEVDMLIEIIMSDYLNNIYYLGR